MHSPFENSIEAPTGIAGPSFVKMAGSRSCMSRTPLQAAGRPVSRSGFLARDAHGPQHALLRLIGTLVGDVRPGRVADLIPT
jgi:hypothetical protein